MLPDISKSVVVLYFYGHCNFDFVLRIVVHDLPKEAVNFKPKFYVEL